MKSRERKAFGGISATATAPAAASVTAPVPARSPADATTPRVLHWEEWFQSATPAQRADMLTLAARQGLLYAFQVPPAANGVKNKLPVENPAHLQPLVRILAGETDGLAPVCTRPLTFIDQELDPAQREAVLRAMATPDVFLLQGLPGTGRSRVLAEILTQAALRGDRVLFLTNHPACLDSVLVRLMRNKGVLALRFLDPSEAALSLPADVLACTFKERQRIFREQTLQQAEQAFTEAERRQAQRLEEAAYWSPLRECAEQMAQLQQRLHESESRLSTLADDVRREATTGSAGGAFGAQIADQEQTHQHNVNTLGEEQATQAQQHACAVKELADVEAAMQVMRPTAEAKRHGRWWTFAWWRATFSGQVLARMTELESRQQTLRTTLQALELSQKQAEDKRKHLDVEFAQARDKLLDDELDRRRQEVLREQSSYRGEQEKLALIWQTQVGKLATPDHRPAEPTSAAVVAAAARWENQRRLDDDSLLFACRWLSYLKEQGQHLDSRIVAWAQVLAGTLSGLRQDAVFADAARMEFDLVVLDEAEQFTETDILQAARYGRRLCLAAQSHGPADGLVPASKLVTGGPQLTPRVACFQRVWQGLHCDSRRLHYAWDRENSRLCCTLRPVSGQERAHLEIEHVADFPEIELRILASPKAPPLLAQVVFPPNMTVCQAKEFIYRELQEVAVRGSGRGAWLVEENDVFRFNLGPFPLTDTVCLDLDTGLREWIVPDTAQTCRLEFVRAAGWTRSQVDAWLQRHLHLRDLGRTMALQVPHRMAHGLAGTLSEVLFAGEYLPAPGPMGRADFEFIAVPPLRKDSKADDKRKPVAGGNGTYGLPKEGAGLEQDLSTQRLADRVPADLRAELPRRGFANFLEAQAVIHKLEELVAQGNGEPLAVIALYEGQVELLRRLVARSPILRQHTNALEIGVPGAFQEREVPTVLVSLTRSHSHRAVSFGEHDSDLVLALTRARKRLLVFGDPGTLVKRSHWQGPLDHLDGAAAALEARRLTALLRWVGNSFPKSH